VLLALSLDKIAQPLWITICALTGLTFLTTSIRISGLRRVGVDLDRHRLRQHDNRRTAPIRCTGSRARSGSASSWTARATGSASPWSTAGGPRSCG
jgi:hypothetical protein